MEFQSPTAVRLTLSEAAWIAGQTGLSSVLRIRAERGRRHALAPFLSPGIFEDIPELPVNTLGNPELRRRILQLSETMRIAALRYGQDERGNELHLVELKVNEGELTAIYGMAEVVNYVKRDKVMNFRESMQALDADDVGPSLGDHDRAIFEEANFQDGLHTLQVTRGIMAAIATQRNQGG